MRVENGKRRTENGKLLVFRLERESGTDERSNGERLRVASLLQGGGKAHAVGLKRKTFVFRFTLGVEKRNRRQAESKECLHSMPRREGEKACKAGLKRKTISFFSEIRENREFSDAILPNLIKFPALPMSWV